MVKNVSAVFFTSSCGDARIKDNSDFLPPRGRLFGRFLMVNFCNCLEFVKIFLLQSLNEKVLAIFLSHRSCFSISFLSCPSCCFALLTFTRNDFDDLERGTFWRYFTPPSVLGC